MPAVLRKAAETAVRVAPSARPPAAPPPAAQAVLRAVANLLAHEDLRAGLTALAALLARDHQCSRVSISLMEPGGRLKLRAVSDVANAAVLSGEAWLDLLTAQEECHDQGRSVMVPAPAKQGSCLDLAHWQLLRTHGGRVACSVPLAVRDLRIGVLTLQRDSGEAFNAEQLALFEHVAAFLCPLISLKQAQEITWTRRLLQHLRRVWWAPNRRMAVAGMVGVAMLLIAAGFMPVAFDVTAPARLEGLVQRSVAAPRDGFLAAVYVRPGDAVKAGQPLAELERENLELEQRRWQSELAKAESEFGEALAARDRSKIVVGQARCAAAAAELARVTRDLERARLLAPFDGIVLEGDLTRSIGAPLKRGESLMTIAPAGGYRLILRVDELDIANVSAGQRGRLALASQPGEPHAIEVARITPLAAAKDGRNTFDVEARVLGDNTGLRPGLEGVARLSAGERSFYSVVGARAYDWLRLKFWSWFG